MQWGHFWVVKTGTTALGTLETSYGITVPQKGACYLTPLILLCKRVLDIPKKVLVKLLATYRKHSACEKILRSLIFILPNHMVQTKSTKRFKWPGRKNNYNFQFLSRCFQLTEISRSVVGIHFQVWLNLPLYAWLLHYKNMVSYKGYSLGGELKLLWSFP